MKRALLICLSLVLALVGWSAVGADDGFYVIPSMKVVAKTGQTTSYDTRDDGAWQKGVTCSIPRFTDNNNGTVTDNLTRLIWMKNASAFGVLTWANALATANGLKSDDAGTGLTDGSQAGDWRLPNVRELQSLLDYSRTSPALPEGHPFTEMWSQGYWSSTTYADANHINNVAWVVYFLAGVVSAIDKANITYVWCVRGGP